MADEPKALTQADIDKAVAAALEEAQSKVDAETQGLKDKNRELLTKLRLAGEIKPEDLNAAEQRADKAEADLAEAKKQVGALTKERDGAFKDRDAAKLALETEQNAARGYALDADINAEIAAGNVVPALVPGLTAMMRSGAKVDLVDGKYVSMIGDKSAREHIKAFLEGEEGKAWRAASANSGGGAPGGNGSGGGGKAIRESEFNALDAKGRAAKMAEGYSLVPDAA